MDEYYYDLTDEALTKYYNSLDLTVDAEHIANVEKEMEVRGI